MDDKLSDFVYDVLDDPSSQLSENGSLFGDDSDYDPTLDIQNFVDSDNESSDESEVQNETLGEENEVEDSNEIPQELIQVENIADLVSVTPMFQLPQNPNNDWLPIDESSQLVEISSNPSDDILGINPDNIDTVFDCVPFQFWNLFVKNEIIYIIVVETNRFATQQKASRDQIAPNARINKLFDTNREVIKVFGIVMYMGLSPLPSIAHY